MIKTSKIEQFRKNLEIPKENRDIPKTGTQVPVLQTQEIISQAKNLFSDFVNAGLSLLEFAPKLEELKQNKNYKLLGYKTWKDCCEEGMETSERWVNEILRGAQIRAALPSAEIKKITSVSQTRALSKVPEEDRAKIIKEAEKKSPEISPKAIKTASEKIKEAEYRILIKDANDEEVPENIADEFQAAETLGSESISRAQWIKNAFEKDDLNTVEARQCREIVKDLLACLKTHLTKHVLCPKCKGKKCAVCSKRGFVSNHFATKGMGKK